MQKISKLKLKYYYGLSFFPDKTKKLETSLLNSRFINYNCPKNWLSEHQVIARDNLYNKFTPFYNVYHVALCYNYDLIKEDVKFTNIIDLMHLEGISPKIFKDTTVYRNFFFVFSFLIALKALQK